MVRKPCSFGDVNDVVADLLGKSITAGLDVDFDCIDCADNGDFANVMDDVAAADDGDVLLILIWTLSVFKTGGGELSTIFVVLAATLYLFV